MRNAPQIRHGMYKPLILVHEINARDFASIPVEFEDKAGHQTALSG
jgi:hypothetical protein